MTQLNKFSQILRGTSITELYTIFYKNKNFNYYFFNLFFLKYVFTDNISLDTNNFGKLMVQISLNNLVHERKEKILNENLI